VSIARHEGHRVIRASFNSETIRIYQAYSPAIAYAALEAQTFRPPFKRERMTWIKPSFSWMAYRSGWAKKQGQEVILGVDMRRSGFDWALANGCLSSFEAAVHGTRENWNSLLKSASVRIQWDPGRTFTFETTKERTIQIGLCREAVDHYIEDWIVRIENLTQDFLHIEELVKTGELKGLSGVVPDEKEYPVLPQVAETLGIRLSKSGLMHRK
jgi:hypothetical protein